MTEPTGWQWESDAWQRIDGVPFTDRGFRHGMSVFETLGVRGGQLLFLGEHLAKLRQACQRTGLRELPGNLFADALEDLALCENGIARLYVTAGDGGLTSPIRSGRILLFLEPRDPEIPRPLRLRLHPTPVVLPWPGLKTGNYWLQIQARQAATDAGFDEAVLIDSADHVISAATANLFAVIDGLLLTPRIATGARPGVVRDWVLQHAEVIVCDFHSAQLLNAEGIFLTSSGIGLRAVSQLGSREMPASSLATSLSLLYEDEVRAFLSRR